MNEKIAKTKYSLLLALLRLLENQDLEKVTVSQLCKEAGINRTTFYRHYAVPADVIEESVEIALEEVLLFDETHTVTLYEYMLRICRRVYENRELMRFYARSNGSLMPLFHKLVMGQMGNLGFMANPCNLFIAGGVGSTIMAWVMMEFRDPPERIAQSLADCASVLMLPEPEELRAGSDSAAC